MRARQIGRLVVGFQLPEHACVTDLTYKEFSGNSIGAALLPVRIELLDEVLAEFDARAFGPASGVARLAGLGWVGWRRNRT